ncbi:J domain-containing protein [Candidatus Gracilibacteria bacterium]|nr:J domain-containing protein [Candidatus Gracilibacteria bacterium]
MANKDYYATLGVNKNATEAEIKKAYRKKAMENHPDKHKGDKTYEAKFKEINEAYQVLSDSQKKKQYDTFGSAGEQFHSYSGGQQGQGFSGFEDIFSNFSRGGGKTTYSNNVEFDLGDIFGDLFGQNQKGRSSGFSSSSASGNQKKQTKTKEEPQNLDVIKIYEVPIMDLILGLKLNIDTVYNENLKLKIPESTKPGTKFKIKGKGRKSGKETGDMYVIVNAKMPTKIPDDVKKLLESIKYRL